jgi:hypothetical protein
MGKTMIVEKFQRLHPLAFHRSSGAEHRPVVIVQMPPGPDDRRFFTRILHELGVPYSSYWRVDALERAALDSLALAKTQVLIIEEVQQLLAGSAREQRLSAPYRLKPWQLLQELGFDPFSEPTAQRQQPIQAFLCAVDLRRLAQLTRTDPSRLDLDRLCPPDWALANDDWVMRCKDCEHDDRRGGIATYERSAWRNSTRTFCQRHRRSAAGTLTASELLIVTQDLLSFAVET